MTRTGHNQRFPTAILIGSLLFQGAFVGILLNSTGLIISAIILDRGFSAAALSPYYTIKMLVGAVSITAMTTLFFRWGARRYLTAMTVVSCICFGIMARFTQPWQWYIDAAIMGVFSSNVMMVIPCIINNWFRKNNGVVTGVVMAASGLAGAIFNPVCSSWIGSMGWQRTAVLVAALVGAVCLTASLFLLQLKPEDCGCHAYGELEAEEGQKAEIPSSFAGVRPWNLLLLCVGVLLAGTVIVQLTNYFPLYAASIGFDLQTGAWMTSFIMVGNVAGKFLAGLLCDRIGPWKTGAGMLTAVAAALVILMTEPSSRVVLYVVSVMFGLVYSASVVVPPLACLDAFGSKAYAGMLSRVTATNSILGAGCNFLIAGIYDRTGSFRLVFLMGLILWGISVLFSTVVLLLRRKSVGSQAGVPV